MLLAIALLAACAGQPPDSTADSTTVAHPGPPLSSHRTNPGSSATVPRSPDVSIHAPGGSSVASGLAATLRCSSADPRTGIVELRWRPAAQRGSAQRVDVTKFSERFDDGKYETSKPLPSDRSSLQWAQVSPGAVHFWRVLTLHGHGWASSRIGRFTLGACIGDYVPTTT
jgi:hypothetical protein